MTTTTEYGTWNNSADHTTATLEDSVATALGEFADQYDVDAIVEDYRDEINESLKETGVSLHGNVFYGPHPKKDVDIKAAVERVDFWKIAQEYEKE